MKKSTCIEFIKTLYKELHKQVKHTKKNDVINLEDIECLYDLDLRKLLINNGLCEKVGEQNTLTITRPLRLSNVKCNILLIDSICFTANNFLQIENSYIDALKVYSSKISSFIIKNSSIVELTISDSTIQEDVVFNFSSVNPKTIAVLFGIAFFLGFYLTK